MCWFPAENSLAYGWVQKLKAQGGKLFARFKQAQDGFRDAVQAGRFKNRSVSLCKDLDGRGLSLRCVGFLGAAAPAARGRLWNAITQQMTRLAHDNRHWLKFRVATLNGEPIT